MAVIEREQLLKLIAFTRALSRHRYFSYFLFVIYVFFFFFLSFFFFFFFLCFRRIRYITYTTVYKQKKKKKKKEKKDTRTELGKKIRNIKTSIFFFSILAQNREKCAGQTLRNSTLPNCQY